jgi:DNA-binding CsgD family transcriptional regulator
MRTEPQLWYEQLLDLVDLLYRAHTPNAIGQALFQGLKELMPFDAAIFTPINWQTLELQEGHCYGSTTLDMAYSQCSHAPFDPLLFDPLCLTRLNEAVRLSDTTLSAHFSASEFDIFYQHMPYRHAMGVVASWRQQPVAAIRLYRHAAEPDFSDAEIKLLNRLALHVANAVYLQDATIALEPLRETGLIVYDADDNLIYKNEAIANMLEGISLNSVLQIVRKDKMWLRNGTELYRAEIVPLTPTSLLTLFAKNEEHNQPSLETDDTLPANGKNHTITIISIEPFRRRHAIANRLKHSGLSPREIDVSLGVIRGLSNSNIAKQLFIDEKTVKDHLQRIYAKIHIRTRTELISKMLGLDTELAHHEIPTPPGVS